MKTLLALLCAVGSCSAVYAQQPSTPDASTASHSEAVPSNVDRTELMLRRLREALTNPPSAGPQAPAPAAASPSAVAPSSTQPKPQPRPGSDPLVSGSDPAGTPPPAAVPPAARILPRSAATNNPAGVRTPAGTTAAPPPAIAGPTPAGRAVPGRPGPQFAAPQPQLPGSALPGVPGAAFAPPGSAPAPGPGPMRTNSVTVAANLNPNEIISAGTIQVQGMEPDQFFDIYSQISGRTVIRNYSLQGLQKITLKAATDWTRQEAVFAMDAVMAQNQIAMIPIGDKFVKAVPMAQAGTEGAAPSRVQPGDYAEAEPFITQVIQLKVVKPTELQQLLSTFTKAPQGITAFDSTQTLVIRDYASNVKRMLEVIQTVDIPAKEPDYKLEAIPIKYGKVIDLYNTMQALISGGGAASGSSTAAGTGSQFSQGSYNRSGAGRYGSRVGGSGGGYGGYGGYGGGGYGGYGGGYGRSYGGYGSGGMYPYEESVEHLSPMQAATPQPTTTAGARTSVGGAQSSFQNRLNQIVRRAATGTAGEEVQVLEDARIVPDERSNKLLVFANRRDMDMITNIVAKVDVLLAQVLIEAIIMEVRLGDSQKLGVSWIQHPQSFGNGSGGAGLIYNGQQFLTGESNLLSGALQGLTYYGRINNDWSAVINALAENSSINVVSRPRIQTSHAIPGSFFVGETVPYITGFTDYGGYGGVSGLATRSVVQQANVGFSLFVTPFITPDGFVVMEISQEFSTRGRDVLIDQNPIPIINGRNADSTLTVRDGDTIMMGGFITENRSRAKSGVPFLKDIPGLGVLFRSKNDSNDRAELVVLMRARVLRSPEEAAIVAAQEKSELPGISKAEEDLKQSNDKWKQKAGKSSR